MSTLPIRDLPQREVVLLLGGGLAFVAREGALVRGQLLSLQVVARARSADNCDLHVRLLPHAYASMEATRRLVNETLSAPESGERTRRVVGRILQILDLPAVEPAALDGIPLVLVVEPGGARREARTADGGRLCFAGVPLSAACSLAAGPMEGDHPSPDRPMPDEVEQALSEQFGKADEVERALAVREVGAWGKSAARPSLLRVLGQLLSNEDERLACTAAGAVRAIGPAAATAEVLGGLTSLLRHPRHGWSEGIATVRALGAAAATPELTAELAALLRHGDAAVRRAAADGVAGLGPAAASHAALVAALLERLSDPSAAVQQAAIGAVAAVDCARQEPARSRLEGLRVQDRSLAVRQAAAAAMGVLLLACRFRLLAPRPIRTRGAGTRSAQPAQGPESTHVFPEGTLRWEPLDGGRALRLSFDCSSRPLPGRVRATAVQIEPRTRSRLAPLTLDLTPSEVDPRRFTGEGGLPGGFMDCQVECDLELIAAGA
jgi:hypothetical protein